MENFLSFTFIAALITGCIAIIIISDHTETRNRQKCEDAGGTWFYHEQACLPIRSIPVK